MRRLTLLLGAVALGIVSLGACSRGAPGSGPMLLEVDGRALATPPVGDPVVVEGQRRLEYGTTVEIVRGSASLTLPGAAVLELREGVTDRSENTRLEASRTSRLLAGDVLVVTEGGTAAEVAVGATTIEVQGGATKVSRGLALSAQVYEGSADVESAGRALVVPALRQAVVPATRLVPSSPQPLAYDALDPWDRRFLADAIELGETMAAKARGFTNQLQPGEGRTAGYYRLLLPELDQQPGFDQPLLSPDRSPGETLVGTSIAVVASGDGSPEEFVNRWQRVFSFREAGAEWGLVALDNGVGRDALMERVDRAIAQAVAPIGGDTASGPGGPVGSGGGSSSGGSSGGPPATPPTTEDPAPPPSTPPTTSNCSEEEQTAAGQGGFQAAAECPRQRGVGDLIGVDEEDDNQGDSDLGELLGVLVVGDDGSGGSAGSGDDDGGLLGVSGDLLAVGAVAPVVFRRRRQASPSRHREL